MSFTCDKCKHVLHTLWGHKRHVAKCNGIGPLECAFCFRIFANKQTKYKHAKICKCNPDNIENGAIITNNTPFDHSTITNSTVNCNIDNSVDNSIDNSVHNTTNNYNNINVIRFEVDKHKHTQFISSHISVDEIKEILDKYFDLRDKYHHIDILNEYFDRLLEIPENKCIQKLDIKSKYSQIHTGDNKWVMKPDRNIYDKLIIDTTKNFFHKLDETDQIKNREFKNKVSNIRHSTEHFADHIFEDEKELVKELQVATNAIKCTVINQSTES